MDKLEEIIKRASCPCRDEECQRELAHVRHAIKEALEMAAQIARVHCTNEGEDFCEAQDIVREVRALAATLDKEEKP